MAGKKVVIPREELDNIADAINNRAEYMGVEEDIQVENPGKQMRSEKMASNIMQLKIDLTPYATIEWVNQRLAEGFRFVVISDLSEVAEDDVIYILNDGSRVLRAYILLEGSPQQVGGEDVDLTPYAKKSEVSAELAKKEDKLTAGTGIDIYDEGDQRIIASTVNPKFKFRITVDSEGRNATLTRVPNTSDDETAMTIGADSPLSVIDAGDGKLVLRIDPDKLEGADSISLDDESSKVATTRFVQQLIREKSDLGKVVKYEIIDEDHPSPALKSEDTLYVNTETGDYFLGEIQLNRDLIWNGLEDIYNRFTVIHESGFSDLDSVSLRYRREGEEDLLYPYVDMFYDIWDSPNRVGWKVKGTSEPIWYPNDTELPTYQSIWNDQGQPDTITLEPVMYDQINFYGITPGFHGSFVDTDGTVTDISIPYDTETVAHTYTLLEDPRTYIDATVPDLLAESTGRSLVGWANMYYQSDDARFRWLNDMDKVDWTFTGMISGVWELETFENYQDMIENITTEPPNSKIGGSSSAVEVTLRGPSSSEYSLSIISADIGTSEWEEGYSELTTDSYEYDTLESYVQGKLYDTPSAEFVSSFTYGEVINAGDVRFIQLRLHPIDPETGEANLDSYSVAKELLVRGEAGTLKTYEVTYSEN